MPPGSYPIRLSAYPTDGSVAIARPSTIVLRVRALLRDTPPVACGGVNVAGLARAVYVSPAGSDGTGCGATPATACATIQQGINSCSGTGCGVLVRYGPGRLDVEVEDNGLGLDGARERPDGNGHGHGLVGIRERVALYGGTVQLEPSAAGGVRLAATLPLSEAP